MRGKRVLMLVALAAVFLSAGCCHWCDRWCSSCRQPPQVACQPCCCQPVCCQPCGPTCPAPAGYPAGTWSRPAGVAPAGCCNQ